MLEKLRNRLFAVEHILEAGARNGEFSHLSDKDAAILEGALTRHGLVIVAFLKARNEAVASRCAIVRKSF